jgi:hypothetical protein
MACTMSCCCSMQIVNWSCFRGLPTPALQRTACSGLPCPAPTPATSARALPAPSCCIAYWMVSLTHTLSSSAEAHRRSAGARMCSRAPWCQGAIYCHCSGLRTPTPAPSQRASALLRTQMASDTLLTSPIGATLEYGFHLLCPSAENLLDFLPPDSAGSPTCNKRHLAESPPASHAPRGLVRLARPGRGALRGRSCRTATAAMRSAMPPAR